MHRVVRWSAAALVVGAAGVKAGPAPPGAGSAPLVLWVSPRGNDAGPGTRAEPLGTPAAALLRVRDARRLALLAGRNLAAARIELRGGTYWLGRTLTIRPEDGGTAAAPLIMEAAPGEHPILSGGIRIRGWSLVRERVPGLPSAAVGRVWAAALPTQDGRPLDFRELWVNGRKAVRARFPLPGTLARLEAWDPEAETATLALPPRSPRSWRDLPRMELVVHQQWEVAVLRLRSWRPEGARAVVAFQSPEGPLEFEHPYPAPVMQASGNAPYFLANAIEFLGASDLWYADLRSGRLYYWPRAGERPDRSEVVAPLLDVVARVAGTPEDPVCHVAFDGLAFEHAGWLRPSRLGHVPLQAGMYLLEAHRLSPPGVRGRPTLDNLDWVGRPPGAVAVRGARDIRFKRCRFEHVGSAGLDLGPGVQDSVVVGCRFADIGGNGLQMGEFSGPDREAHVPFTPADARVLCARVRVADNVFADCANEDWGCVGIAAGYVRSVSIEHNEVRDLPYSGISLGWGWTPASSALGDNRVVGNYVHRVARLMSDEGGIYLLSSQPGTVVANNRIDDIAMSPYAEDPAHWFYLYLDEGSSHIVVRDNWCPAPRFLRNANGPGNVWTDNGPDAPDRVRLEAGLEPAYRVPP